MGRWIPRQMYRRSQPPSPDHHILTLNHSVSVSNCCLLRVVSSPCDPLLVGYICLFRHAICILRQRHNFTKFHATPSCSLQLQCLCMFVRGCLLVCVRPVECVCVCVGGCFLPPATLHLSVELVRLKLACSQALKAIHALSGHRTLSLLTLKGRIPFSNRVYSEHAQ